MRLPSLSRHHHDVEVTKKQNSTALSALLIYTDAACRDVKPGRFHPSHVFREYGGPKDQIQVASISDDFREWFMHDALSVHVGESTKVSLKWYMLDRLSTDIPIIGSLGGQERVVLTLIHVYTLLWRQRNAGFGPLLPTGYPNVFYIKDYTGTLRAVYLVWDSKVRGWHIRANAVTHPGGWSTGTRFFVPTALRPA